MKVGAIDVPVPDDDPAMLAALYSGFAMYEVWRKVVLAECRELCRSSAALEGKKVTEARLDDLAHTHRAYLEYLEKHLRGRVNWEREVQTVQRGGYGA